MPDRLLAYTDKLSVEPDEIVEVKVSSPRAGTYRASLVRVICGDDSDDGPGFKVEPWPACRPTTIPPGISRSPAAPMSRSRTGNPSPSRAFPSAPSSGRPGSTRAASNASSATGTPRPRPAMRSISMPPAGSRLRIGDQAPLVLPHNLMPRHWYLVAASFDAKSGRTVLASRRLMAYGHSGQRHFVEGQLDALRHAQPFPDRGLERRQERRRAFQRQDRFARHVRARR